MTSHHEGRGWTSAREEGGSCSSWRVGRIQENKAPSLVFYAQVNSVFLSIRVIPHSGEQMGRWKH